MALVEWAAKYETGYLAIDTQHKHLFSLVNDLHDALMAGQGKSRMGVTLKALATYTAAHFLTEETLMTQLLYPGMPEHKRKHEELAGQVRRLVADFEAGRLTLPLTLARFLADWLAHHIEEEDLRLIEWVKAKNQV